MTDMADRRVALWALLRTQDRKSVEFNESPSRESFALFRSGDGRPPRQSAPTQTSLLTVYLSSHIMM